MKVARQLFRQGDRVRVVKSRYLKGETGTVRQRVTMRVEYWVVMDRERDQGIMQAFAPGDLEPEWIGQESHGG